MEKNWLSLILNFLSSIIYGLLLVGCASNEVQMTNKQTLFNNCMSTFEDEAKCKKLLDKSEEDLRTEEEKKRIIRESLTQEERDGLKIRSKLKDDLQNQTKPFVKTYIGEPDKTEAGGDREYWVYTRPIARYSVEHDPDEEITVIFRRNRVERVNHIKAETTPESNFSFKKLFDKDSKKPKPALQTETPNSQENGAEPQTK